MLNIADRARLQEPGYRYRRDQLTVVHEKFKGTVTRIVNLDVVARQLRVPLEGLAVRLVKRVKTHLGLSTCKPLTFPGHHEAECFDDHLQVLIETLILCPKCRLPEWNNRTCDACGYAKA